MIYTEAFYPAAIASHPPAPSLDLPLLERYRQVRQQSLALVESLTPEDMMVQSSPETSPAKWHLAHTAWFFETFVLREFAPGYQPYHPDFLRLFNSYYNAVSDQPARQLRAVFSRPTLEAVLDYRRHVDSRIEQLLASGAPEEAGRRLVLGLHHEQQHQELLLTDIKHAFWSNPLRPLYREAQAASTDLAPPQTTQTEAAPENRDTQRWRPFAGGLHRIGIRDDAQRFSFDRSCFDRFCFDRFCFDNEQPRHRVYLEPFELATRPVSCAQYFQFLEDGGYRRPELWLAEGWQMASAQRWEAPLYWHREADAWKIFTLRGDLPLHSLADSPVCHLSYFEADAFARWAGAALPTEAEWEVAAALSGAVPQQQYLLEGGALHPMAAPAPSATPRDSNPTQGARLDSNRTAGNRNVPAEPLRQMLGGVWEWTASAYLGYPGYNAAPGALGEYNGKFMSGQMVLRGGSVATPASHIRETYRNFFPPGARWQFSGIRLARR